MREIAVKADLYQQSHAIYALKQFDTTDLIITILANKASYNLDGLTVTLNAVTADKHAIIMRNRVEVTLPNVVTVHLADEVTALAGEVQFELVISHNGEQISTYNFNGVVEPALIGSDVPIVWEDVSGNIYKALALANAAAEALKEQTDIAHIISDNLAMYLQAIDTALAQMEQYDTDAAESARESAESAKQALESADDAYRDRQAVETALSEITVMHDTVVTESNEVSENLSAVEQLKSQIDETAEQVSSDAIKAAEAEIATDADRQAVSEMVTTVTNIQSSIQETATQVSNDKQTVVETKSQIDTTAGEVAINADRAETALDNITETVDKAIEDITQLKDDVTELTESAETSADNAAESERKAKETADGLAESLDKLNKFDISKANVITDTTETAESLEITGTAEAPLELALYGASSQVSTRGVNLFDSDEWYRQKGSVVKWGNITITYDPDDYTFTLDGILNTGSASSIFLTLPELIPMGEGLVIHCKHVSGTAEGGKSIIFYWMARKADGTTENVSGAIMDNEDTTKNVKPGSYVGLGSWRFYADSNGSDVVFNNYKMRGMVTKAEYADAPYEPYTGGQPSPSPDFPQPIATDEDYTVTVSNGMDTQIVHVDVPLYGIPDGSGGWTARDEISVVDSKVRLVQRVDATQLDTTKSIVNLSSAVLPSETITDITDTPTGQALLNLHSYNGTTTITTDAIPAVDLSATYSADTKSYINKKFDELAEMIHNLT